jgi:hypothetical protein
MTQKLINVGEGANSGTGDSIRDAFVKVNDNFNELYFNGVTGIIEQRIQDFIGNLNTSSYISTTTMNVLADLLYISTATLTTRVGVVETNVNTLTNRVATLETTVTTGLGTASANLNATALGLVTSLNTLTTTVTNLTTRVDNIEVAATALSTRVTTAESTLNTRIATAETTATALTTRVTSAETATTALSTRVTTAERYLVPTGVIMMWSGAQVAIPTGYVLCDGLNGSPDLRDRFVVGAGASYAVGAVGGSKDAVVVSHTHSAGATAASTVSDPGHVHQSQYDSRTPSGIDTNGAGSEIGGMGFPYQFPTTISATGISVGTTVAVTVNGSGVSGTDQNLPPYYALCYIMKT